MTNYNWLLPNAESSQKHIPKYRAAGSVPGFKMPGRSQTLSLKVVANVPFIIILPDLLFTEKLVSV